VGRRALVAVAVLVAFGILAATGWAAEINRTEFREAAEPICQTDTKANERILAGVRNEVRQGKLGPAAGKFGRAAAALKQALVQLEALPRPVADEGRLTKWFGTVRTETGYFEAVSRELRKGQKAAAGRFVNKLTVTATKANAQVLPFEFDYCRLEPSRFT
jgi:hypothetical protein